MHREIAGTKETLFLHFSLLMGTTVLDPHGNRLGRIREIAIVPDTRPPVVSEMIWGRRDRLMAVAPSGLEPLHNGALRLRTNALPRRFSMGEPLLMLDRDLMDQQIIDIHGRKVVRVNDIALFWFLHDSGGEMSPFEVEVGTRGAMRRLLKGLATKHAVESIASQIPSRAIPWEFVDPVVADPARHVRLKISHERLAEIHPSDLADILEDLAPAQRDAIFSLLDEEVAAEALEEVEPKLQKRLVQAMDSERAADLMQEMDPSAAADLLGELGKEHSEAILQEMEPEERQEVKDLLEFSERSAAGRMTTNYIAILGDSTVTQAIEALRKFDDDPETVTTLYLVDEDGSLTGSVPLARLLLVAPEEKIAVLSDARTVSCPSAMPDQQVAELFDRYNLYALPVVDEHNKLVGVINADHVISFLRQQA